MLLLRLVALTTQLATPLQPTVRYNDSHNCATCTRAAVASTCMAACYLWFITTIPITAPPAPAPPSLQLAWLLQLSSPNLGCALTLEHTHSRCFNLRGCFALHSRHFDVASTKLEVSRRRLIQGHGYGNDSNGVASSSVVNARSRSSDVGIRCQVICESIFVC